MIETSSDADVFADCAWGAAKRRTTHMKTKITETLNDKKENWLKKMKSNYLES